MNSTTRNYFFKGFINSDTFDYCLHEWKTYKLFHTDDEEVRKIDISVANVVSVSALVCYCPKVGARANTKKKSWKRTEGERRKETLGHKPQDSEKCVGRRRSQFLYGAVKKCRLKIDLHIR